MISGEAISGAPISGYEQPQTSSVNTGSFSTTTTATANITGVQLNQGAFSITTDNAVADIVSQTSNTGSFSATTSATANITGTQKITGSVSVTTSAAANITGTQRILGQFDVTTQNAIANIQSPITGSFGVTTANAITNITGFQEQTGHSHDPHRYDFTLDLDVTRRKKPVEAQEIPEPKALESEALDPEVLDEFQEPVEVAELIELQQYSEKIKTLIDEAKTEFEKMESVRKIQDENKLNDEEMAIVLCIAELL